MGQLIELQHIKLQLFAQKLIQLLQTVQSSFGYYKTFPSVRSLSNIMKGKILHDKTFAAAAATENHFLCNIVKLPITGLPKIKVLSRLREKKRERWEKGKQRQRERKS
jgi:hypothetical protein